MSPGDMVFNTVYKRCLAAKCTEVVSHNAAVSALQKFKNNQFTTPVKLIDQAVTDAKKLTIKVSKNVKVK